MIEFSTLPAIFSACGKRIGVVRPISSTVTTNRFCCWICRIGFPCKLSLANRDVGCLRRLVTIFTMESEICVDESGSSMPVA